jgi:tetratricopeptide (TPR) repeat protein
VRQHAGATIIDDDSASTDESEQTSSTGAAGAKNDKSTVPVVEYKENAQTEALCKQAVVYSTQKQYPQAISLLTQAITHDPRTIEARRLYAQATILNNEPDRAISVLLLLAKYTKPTVIDKCMLASAYYAKNDSALAITNFKDATQLAPDNFYAEEGLLKSILLQQDYPAAAAECTAALQRFKNPSAQIAIKKIYAQVVASRNAAKAIELQPGDSRLSPPIPLPELTPYVMQHSYGG